METDGLVEPAGGGGEAPAGLASPPREGPGVPGAGLPGVPEGSGAGDSAAAAAPPTNHAANRSVRSLKPMSNPVAPPPPAHMHMVMGAAGATVWASAGGLAGHRLATPNGERAKAVMRNHTLRLAAEVGHVEHMQPHRSHWTLGDFLLGSIAGQLTFMFFLAATLILGGALALHFTHGAEGVFDSDDFLQLTWFSWGIFFDPGTQTVLAPDEKTSTKTVTVLFSILGFVFNLTLLGLVVDIFRKMLEYYKDMHSRIVVNDHFLVLGWTDKSLFVINELLAMLEGQTGTIVAMGEASKLEMDTQIRQSCRIPKSVQVMVRQGTPHEIDDLERVSIKSARTVIVLGQSRKPGAADGRMLTVVLAIQALKDRPRGHLIAEVRKAENLTVLSRIAASRSEADSSKIVGIVASQHVDHMLAVSILQPDLGQCYATLMSFEGDELYIISVQKALRGKTFGEALPQMTSCVVIGIKLGGGDQSIVISPDDGHVLQASDRFIIITDNVKSATQLGQPTYHHSGLADSIGAGLASIGSGVLSIGADIAAAVTPRGEPPGGPSAKSRKWGAVKSIVGELPKMGVAEVEQAVNPGLRSSMTLALIGWRAGEGTPLLLESLDRVLPTGSKIVILSARSEAQRQADLLEHHMALDGGPVGNKPGMTNLSLQHIYGPSTALIKLQELPLAELSGVMIVDDQGGMSVSTNESEDETSTDWAQLADASTMSAVLLLDELRVTSLGPDAKGPNVVCEFVDNLTQRILSSNDLLSSLPQAVAFHSNEFQMGLLAMTAREPEVALVLEEIFDPATAANLLVVGITNYFSPAEIDSNPLCFWQLLQRVRERGDVLIGWSRLLSGQIKRQVTLNPPSKAVGLQWAVDDRLLIGSENYSFSNCAE